MKQRIVEQERSELLIQAFQAEEQTLETQANTMKLLAIVLDAMKNAKEIDYEKYEYCIAEAESNRERAIRWEKMAQEFRGGVQDLRNNPIKADSILQKISISRYTRVAQMNVNKAKKDKSTAIKRAREARRYAQSGIDVHNSTLIANTFDRIAESYAQEIIVHTHTAKSWKRLRKSK